MYISPGHKLTYLGDEALGGSATAGSSTSSFSVDNLCFDDSGTLHDFNDSGTLHILDGFLILMTSHCVFCIAISCLLFQLLPGHLTSVNRLENPPIEFLMIYHVHESNCWPVEFNKFRMPFYFSGFL